MITKISLVAMVAMAIVVCASNFLVQIPINDWLTWGAITYPFAFLITDVVNRTRGPAAARQVVLAGFLLGVVLSLWLADTRIAIASGTAFLGAQLLDILIFNRLRDRVWWMAPGVSSAISSVVDTVLFFTLAFAGSGLPWHTWAAGDLMVKWLVVTAALIPYAMLVQRLSTVNRTG